MLGDRSPEVLIALLINPTKSGKGGGGVDPGCEGGRDESEGYKQKGITKLKRIIQVAPRMGAGIEV